jgi:hypothetical protein
MSRREILDLISEIEEAESAAHQHEFFAPLTAHGRARMRIAGMIREYRVANAREGWWICQPRDARHADVVAEALPWQRGEYVALWPALRLVLLEPLRQRSWLALPFNPSDAAQRFGLTGPIIVRLVEGGRPFDRIVGRVEGTTIWYDDVDRRADTATAEALRANLAAGQEEPRVAALGAGERAAYALFVARQAEARRASEQTRVEAAVSQALEIGGARLLSYETVDGMLRVTWERDGRRDVTIVRPDLEVISAGVCLSGDEAHFDLASIVGVVREAPDYARWDEELT